MKIIFYQSWFNTIGGVETMAYNWCWWLRNFYDITVLYSGGDHKRLKVMSKLVNIEQYDKNKEYECDIFIRNSVWGEVPTNIKAKRKIEMRHANYKYLLEKGELYKQYHDMGIREIVGCGEFVSRMSDEVLHDHPTTIKNILMPRRKTNKILRLISCTRLDEAKGWNRMLKLMGMMKKEGIKFQWDIFTNSEKPCGYEEVHFYRQRYDIWDYLASADYTVLLSDSEGLPYTVQESLQYQVPCIVTDVGGCTELIKDGVNGYVVPLDMNFDVNKIKEIPICDEYENHALEDWLNYLGYDGEIDKEKIIENSKEEEEMKVRVRATRNFNDVEGNQKRIAGKSEWECEEERAKFLVENNAVEIIGEVAKEELEVKKEEKPIEAKEVKAEPKKAPKKKVNKKVD